MAEKKLNINELKLARLSWKNVLDESLSDKERIEFSNRKKAVDMYIDGYKLSEITKETSINQSYVLRLVNKCLKKTTEGNELGYIALLKYKRTKEYCRITESEGRNTGFSGSLHKLLLEYPSLDMFIRNNLFGNKKDTLEKNISATILYHKFLEECKKIGIQDYEYPFNTITKGKRSFSSYVSQLLKKNASQAIQRESTNIQQKFNSTGYGKKYSSIPLAPYSIIQLDGHEIDMLYTVEIENKDGEIIQRTATRAWLIAVIDVATRTILGYSITANENYNQTDVLKAIQDAIKPRKKLIFTLPGLVYPSNGGYPSFAIPEAQWALFDGIMLDNVKSHLSKDVVTKLTEKLMCSVNFGSVATPETRGIVERMFKTIEENGYHRMPSTTGSNINDPRRINAESDAIKYKITFEDIVELTEYFVSLYNNSPHTALDNETPLQRMERRINKAGMYPYIASLKEKELVESLTNIKITRKIRGGYKNGKRPYISYLGVEYRNDIIASSMGLIGETIILEINPEDISYLKAYLSDGAELGIFYATGEWGKKPHSLKTRTAAMKLAKENSKLNTPFYAPITEYEDTLRQRAKSSRRAATRADIIKKEQMNTTKQVIKKENDLIKATHNIVLVSEHSKSISEEIEKEQHKINIKESYTDEIEKLLQSMTIEEAFEKGLI